MTPLESQLRRRGFLQWCAIAGAGIFIPRALPRATAATAATAEISGWPGIEPKQVADRMEELLAKHAVPGAAVAIVRDGQPVWQEGFGLRRAGQDPAPVTPETVFRASSISKPVFGIAVLKLVEDGRLDLDRPLQDYLDKPWLPDDPLLERVTARMVLNHTTGWPNWRRSEPMDFKYPPGEQATYSGEGFIYLQTVVEKITGEPLVAWLRSHLLIPFGMTSSDYVWREAMAPHMATGYNAQGHAVLRPSFKTPNTGNSLLTTCGDLAKVLAAMIAAPPATEFWPGPAFIEQMLTPELEIPTRPGAWRGLGWALQLQPSAFYHTGSNAGFRSVVMASRESRNGLVFLSNSDNGRKAYIELIESVTGEQPAFGGEE